MSTAPARSLAERIVTAHGGIDAWARAGSAVVLFSAGGIAFWTKGQPQTLNHLRGEFSTTGQQIRLEGNGPRPWRLDIQSSTELLARHERLCRGRLHSQWTIDDVATFAATAMSTYLQLPFILLDNSVDLELLTPHAGCQRIAVRIPETFATHCPTQILHVGRDGVLRRHDYTALAFGKWARAAQRLGAYRTFDGLLVPTRRRVTPRVAGCRLAAPTLVWIDIADLHTTPAQ